MPLLKHNRQKKKIKIIQNNKSYEDTIYQNYNINRIYTLENLVQRRNKIAIIRKWGGVGDILNTRMIFKKIKDLYPFLHITYAVPVGYFSLLDDHPFIDELIDIDKISLEDYGYVADISKDCGKYEMAMAPHVDKQRGDIWAEKSLGIVLNEHEFHLTLDQNKILNAKKILEQYDTYKNDNLNVIICPTSAAISKDLPKSTLNELIQKLKSHKYNPFIMHKTLIYDDLNVPVIHGLNFKEFIHVMALFPYIISVDTGSFHLSAALKIPTVGIFSWTGHDAIGKFHPKAEFVQFHRNNTDGLNCCPCWNWGGCKYRVDRRLKMPLKCMELIDANKIFQKFTELTEKYPK